MESTGEMMCVKPEGGSDHRGAAQQRGIAGSFGAGGRLVKNGGQRIGELRRPRNQSRDTQYFRYKQYKSAQRTLIADEALVVQVGGLPVKSSRTNGVIVVVPEKLVYTFQRPGR